MSDVRGGRSRVLVMRGEAGVGKTALLDYLVERASGCRIARATGVESEMELAFAGLHQLVAPLLDRLELLPAPQRGALGTAFGLTAGPRPDRFLVGLAVLGLLADVAERDPLICVVDDAQWLDRVSAQTLAFVARRLLAERVGLVFAERGERTQSELADLPGLAVAELSADDARGLLDSVLSGPVDEQVREQILAETHGNPLALLELPRGLTPAELAGGFGLPDRMPLSGRIERGFLRRLQPLPEETRRLLLTAAAEPVGDVSLLWRAVGQLGIEPEAAAAAEATGLIELGARVRFRHPLVRSAAYRSASPQERQEVHRALSAVTDPERDPDRRAWHRAQATPGNDEEVAADLERSARRARSRGGAAAAAAFLEHAARLTPEPARRAQRALAAARAKRDAGALDVALGLLAATQTGPPDALRDAEADRLRGQIAVDQQRGREAARLLLSAARRLEPLDARLSREAHLEALAAAIWDGEVRETADLGEVAEAARSAPPAPEPPRAVDLALDALATRYSEGHAAAAPAMTRALRGILALEVDDEDVGSWLWLAGHRIGGVIALEVWDWDARHALAARHVELARRTGALVQLQNGLDYLAGSHLIAGDLTTAARLIDEARLLAVATGNPPATYVAMGVEAFRGRETEASELIDAIAREAMARGQGPIVSLTSYSSAVLYNGLGRYDAARDAAQQAFERDLLGYRAFFASELAEAASRTGDHALVATALAWMSEQTSVAPSDWALGVEARVRGLAGAGDAAERDYRESIERLSHTRVRVELARAHLLFGEWLRREGRRVDAREQLRTAHEMLSTMGLEAFAERARRELRATGETVRKRSVETRDDLTTQEAQIARLAAEGLSNADIGTRLFLSPRTVEWHMKKVFRKLGINSRKQIGRALDESV